jgi:hypothetical protein
LASGPAGRDGADGALAAIVRATEEESAVFAASLLPAERRDERVVWAPLCGPRFAAGLEAIYEGYLLHHGRSRLFSQGDPNAALLCGDFLYARGLAWIAQLGDVEAVAALAELISLAARGRAEPEPPDDFALWAATACQLAERGDAAGYRASLEALRLDGDPALLEARVAPLALGASAELHARLAGAA